ncbi:3-deoxy-D-manno-octulosonic acid transferase [Shimia sp.]|uniref:3-deoxy-D-manno-octulosonic acid transferase n=1 Tax=Shimia sp. TaxID=1954381 RepID=UPI003B8B1BEB
MELKTRVFLGFWSLIWNLFLPAILLYLRKRARKDALYGDHLNERFGRYRVPMQGAVWVHAVSLGELRSAVPLIKALLAQGEKVVVTQFTPAGRRETERVFAQAIASGQLQSVWVPLETKWAYRGFFHSFQPKYGLVMEIEIWPRMAVAAKRASVPLFMCNAQYPSKSIEKDKRSFGLRPAVMRQFAGAFVKSDLQAARFAAVGVKNIHVTGELRFDQPIPEHLTKAGLFVREKLGAIDRPVITYASTVEGEDSVYIETMHKLQAQFSTPPLFVYVPRRPERFDEIYDMLQSEGFAVLRRSSTLPDDLSTEPDQWELPSGPPDILLGDSLGEMYFYLALADKAVVGGGFVPAGAHNIIEPLALKKPVMTGPQTWTIEYPFEEAKAAGVAAAAADASELCDSLAGTFAPDAASINQFFTAHAGGTEKLLSALPAALKAAHSKH